MNINEYIESLRQARLSPSTIQAYSRELQLFREYARARHLRLTQMKPKIVLEYLKHVSEQRPSGGEAIRRRMTALSTYFDYVERTTDGRIRNPLAPLRRPRRQQPKATPVEDYVVEKLITEISDLRDKAIVMLFAGSGLRLSELVSLNKSSISIEEENGRVVGVGTVIGKGDKERAFLVDLPTLAQLHAYSQERGEDREVALFASNRKKRMSQRAIQHMLWKWCDRLGIERIHPHALRHTASSTWHRLGMDTLKISTLLGHNSIATTQLYIKPDAARLRAEYFAAMEARTRLSLPGVPDSDTNQS